MRESGGLPGKRIQIGRGGQAVAVAAQPVGAQRIRSDQDDVWPGVHDK